MLQAVGMNPEEERTYRELVRMRSASSEELCRRLGLTEEQARPVLDALAAKGLLTHGSGQPRRLIAAPPSIVGEVLLLQRMEQLQQARAAFSRLAAEYRSAGWEQAPDELVEVTPGEAVPQRFEQLQRRASSQILAVDDLPYVVPQGQNAVEIEQLAAGVEYRAIYARAAVEQPGALEHIRRYVQAGEQARVLDRVPLKMVIVDRSVALVPLAAQGLLTEASGWALINQCSLLDALIALFEALWASGLPLGPALGGERGGERGGGVSASDAQILTLLLAGLTDEVIARQLGLGRRTVVRRVRQLMGRAGVSSRIQLGWHACQHQWLAPHSQDHQNHQNRQDRQNHRDHQNRQNHRDNQNHRDHRDRQDGPAR